MKNKNTVKISKILAHNLKALREQHKLSASGLAAKCGVTRQAIYKLETGDAWISLALVGSICKAYKIEQHELFQPNPQGE